jgi:N-dimethylarginine dimethylaminohydrolase
MKIPDSVLMVRPDHFQIEYAINRHMLDASGSLNQINVKTAIKQWEDLKQNFQALGLKVEVIDGVKGLPDMVFCANQMFPFFDREGKPAVIASRMKNAQRAPEVAYLEDWAKKRGFNVFPTPEGFHFEGTGDAIWNYEADEIYFGFGFRSDFEISHLLKELTGKTVHALELVSDNFYHLDTALCILDSESAIWVEEAFSKKSAELLKDNFPNLFSVPMEEATKSLAANATSIGGKRVLIESSSTQAIAWLEKHGYEVHKIVTSEFLKSGGSVFCMKWQFHNFPKS